MTTVSQPFPTLAVTAADDDMEISSEFGRAESDIEIDFDLTEASPRGQDDDYMLEDAKSPAAQGSHQSAIQTSNDDVMIDQDGQQEDGSMRDDMTVQDEHLTDVGDYMHDYAVIDDAHQFSAVEVPEIIVEGDQANEQADEEIIRQPEEAGYLHQEFESNANGGTLDIANGPTDNADQGAHPRPSAGTDIPEDRPDEAPLVVEDPAETPGIESSRVPDVSEKVLEADHNAASTQEEATRAVDRDSHEGENQASEEARDADYETSGHEQHEDTHPLLDRPHPCVVIYQGSEISLFPPSEQDASETFFLQDESLAHRSIYDLLQSCRQVLGETIREEDELEINIAEVGLCISEDSTAAPHVSFSQILDLYVQLQKHDGVQEPDPLYVTLTTKTRFTTRLASLLQAATEGRGLLSLDLPHDVNYENPYLDADSSADHDEDHTGQRDDQDYEHHPADSEEHPGQAIHSASTDAPSMPDESSRQPQTEGSDFVPPPATGVEIPDDQHLHEESTYTEQETTRPPTTSIEPSRSPVADEVGGQDDDLIDYADGEDAEDGASGESAGSSTLRGDASPRAAGQYMLDDEFDDLLTDDTDGAATRSNDSLQTTSQPATGGQQINDEATLTQEASLREGNGAAADIPDESALQDWHEDYAAAGEGTLYEDDFEAYDDGTEVNQEGTVDADEEVGNETLVNEEDATGNVQLHPEAADTLAQGGYGAAQPEATGNSALEAQQYVHEHLVTGDDPNPLDEFDFVAGEDSEYFNFDEYPEDDPLADPEIDPSALAEKDGAAVPAPANDDGNDSDAIDYDDEDDEPITPTEPAAQGTPERLKGSPLGKRSREEDEGDADGIDDQNAKRVRSG